MSFFGIHIGLIINVLVYKAITLMKYCTDLQSSEAFIIIIL